VAGPFSKAPAFFHGAVSSLTLTASASTMWKLMLRQHSIDIDAARRLLITRYGWASDDVEHDDPFQPHP
jgi:hypothetical protein